MSNNQMVSAPATTPEGMVRSINALLALDARGSLFPHGVGGLARDLLTKCAVVLSRPVEQHQGEPVALPACKAKLSMSHDWDQGYAAGWSECLDEIAKLGPLYPRPVQDEPVSRWTNKTGDQFRLCPVVGNLEVLIREYGNPDKWVAVNMTPAHALTHLSPLYTHADPAEVERLRAQIAKLQAGFYQQVVDADLKKIADYVSNPDLPKGAFLRQDAYDLANMCMHMVREVQASRAQLARRDALLRDRFGDIRKLAERACGRPKDSPEYRSLIEAINPTMLLDLTALSASAEPIAPHEEAQWHPLTAPGQIQEGDRLSFRVGSSFICARARQIIAPGTDKEEIVYNRKKNHYFLTSMAVDGTSSHKNVMVARVTA